MTMTAKPKLIGIYMAAGSSRRMGEAKLSLELPQGKKLGQFALAAALASELDTIIIVTGEERGRPDWLPDIAAEQIAAGRCQVEVCLDAHEGMASSLRAGLKRAQDLHADGAVIILADQPLVAVEMIDRLAARFRLDQELPYVASGDRGVPKPPVLLSRAMFPAVLAIEGDAGARVLFQTASFQGAVLEEPKGERFFDVDTPADYEYFKSLLLGCVM